MLYDSIFLIKGKQTPYVKKPQAINTAMPAITFPNITRMSKKELLGIGINLSKYIPTDTEET
jgi:hypothetical protein